MRRRLVRTPVAVSAVLAAAALCFPLATDNPYYLRMAALVAIALILTSSLNLIYGYAGQISIGHVGFYAVGAYGTAIFMTRYDQSFWLAWPAATALTAALGWLIGRPVLRLRHFYLAVATLGFGVVVFVVINRWNDVTGGPIGVLGITRPSLFGDPLDRQDEFYLLAAVAALVVLVIVHLVVTSPFGRTLRAIREGEVPVAALGIDPARKKLAAFTLSAALAGVAGGLFATLDLYIGPGSFAVEQSILLLAVLVIAGLGRESGAVVAALLLILLPEAVRSAGENQHLLYAIALLAATLYLPDGVVGLASRLGHAVVGRGSRAVRHEVPVEVPPPGARAVLVGRERAPADAPGPLLEVTGLHVAFGGFVAIEDFDVDVGDGELVGLIGANGAGKSTFINAVTGVVPSQRGTVRLLGEEIGGRPTHQIAAAGIVRTFQTTRLFTELSVAENVLVAAHGHRAQSDVAELLALVGLQRDADLSAGSLPFGRRRLLELVRALAAKPRLLLLDEPAAGLNEVETEHLGDVLVDLRDGGLSILLVEHDLGLVLGVSDRVVAMGFGAKLAEGAPEEVVRNDSVIESYLGTRAGGAPTPTFTTRHN
jgi:ABC-type branched-subunit amino acid transport system permease subunit/ABC-type branched-subunit amino acid transport system ATPase component